MNTIDKSGNDVVNVLHLDDDPFQLDRLRQSLAASVACQSWNVRGADNCPDFERLLRSDSWDLLIVDLGLEGNERRGVNLIRDLRAGGETAPVVVLSHAHRSELVAEAILAGADDVIAKADQNDAFVERIHLAYQAAVCKRKSECVANQTTVSFAGQTMRRIAQRVPKIVSSAVSSVHIYGPSGAGKEIVADIFEAAQGAGKPFVRVNCGALTGSVLHSELFGHVRGAFTGAAGEKRGLIEEANGGWLYLDEVACLSLEAQMALLRVLENNEVRRVGATEARRVNVRVISATNEKLSSLVEVGKFRLDLWQRIQDVCIELPPLSNRRCEVPQLIEHFLRQLPNGPYKISSAAHAVLMQLDFDQGNVRELRNCMRAMTESHLDGLLTPQSIPKKYLERLCQSATTENRVAPNAKSDEQQLDVPESDFEALVQTSLAEHLRKRVAGGRRTSLRRLATELRMSRTTLGHRVQQLAATGMLAQRELSLVMGRHT